MKLKNENDILDQATRKKLIEEWDSSNNLNRKAQAFKAYECLKDKTINYVLDLLLKQFDFETVVEMQYAMSNISIFRKVVSKLAKVYSHGVKRTMPAGEEQTKKLETFATYLNMNQAMTKANKYFRAFHNTMVYVRPIGIDDKFDLRIEALPPFSYDVVEDPQDPTKAMAVVLSDYMPKRPTMYSLGDASRANRGFGEVRNVDAPVQDFSAPTGNTGGPSSPSDSREFIWWTKNYHFTTDVKGQIIAPVGQEPNNPIMTLPFVNLVAEQDGQFWSEGGKDLIDTGISVNVGLTNIKHAGFSQGFGQLFMTGKDLPKSIKTGINHCVQLEQHDKDDPAPQIGFLQANPMLDSLKSILEMEVALMLTTNNLSTSGFATTLQGGTNFASGIALMIDKSESVEDVEEQSAVFVEKEPFVFDLAGSWMTYYSKTEELTGDAAAIQIPDNLKTEQTKFPSPKPVMSELELLDIFQKRKDMGINTMVEIVMRDDPSLSQDEAKAKIEGILAEKANRSAAFMKPVQPVGVMDGNKDNGDNGDDRGNIGDNNTDGGSKDPGID